MAIKTFSRVPLPPTSAAEDCSNLAAAIDGIDAILEVAARALKESVMEAE